MSARNRRDQKQFRRLQHAFRDTPSRYLNLIEYLKDRRHARTTGEAKALLIAGKVMVDSHVVGRLEVPDPARPDEVITIATPLLEAHHRGRITVLHG